jgi:VAD1 Analog of StAR-related lipid transfer domain/GRAM domain
VRASTLHETIRPELQLDGASNSSGLSSTDKLATSETLSSLNTSAFQAPDKESPKRSTSPGGRLRDALNPRRGPSPSSSPDRKTDGAGGFGGSLARDSSAEGLNKRGSVASRIGAIFPDKQTAQTAPGSELLEPQSGKPQHIDTNARPRTPPASDNTTPIIVNTPPTPTDPGSQNFSGARERGTSDPITITNPNVVTSASGNMISHRRIRSGSATVGPSKLSSITPAPLTPTPENGPMQSGSNTNSNQQGGFFSTVFSAAQNAANTLSNSIANTSLAPGQNKNKGVLPDLKGIENVEIEPEVEDVLPGQPNEQKEPAVKTLGMGDLSLSHLGIPEPNGTPTASQFPEVQEQRGRSESANRDEPSVSRTVTSLVAESFESGLTTQVDDLHPFARPRSFYEPSTGGERTPPNENIFDSKGGIARNGSIRSVANPRRKRGSSATTGTTMGTAVVAANTSITHPNAQGITPKLTGFAVASKKRNRDFHQLFRSVPEDDYLIEDYSCALQREILAHGRLYVSEGHLCFSSNIFGWVTTLVMSFDEIISVEKRSTALVFKNGLMISTLHAKNIFASFTSRDSTYDLIVGIWKLGHPNLRSSLNGVSIEETGGGDKTEKYDTIGSLSGSGSEDESEEGDEVYDEDDGEDGMSYTQTGEGSVADSDAADKPASRKPSAIATPSNGAPAEKVKDGSPTTSSTDFPGPVTHAPTECSDKESHYDKVIGDDIIPAPLGKVYSMLFGPASPFWMSKWLTNEQKCLELQMEDKKGLSSESKVRIFSYIKPLNSSIGPKQTKCIITETLDSLDLEKAVSVTVSTQTPDVPSGNVFSVKTKYCLSWAENNYTHLQMNCTIEWTGKSWLKGMALFPLPRTRRSKKRSHY